MKKLLIKVLRTHPKKGNQFWQTFEYEGRRDVPISEVLDEINAREKIIDTNLDIATPIKWDCNCRDHLCGTCAMVINHVPRLACTTILGDVLHNGEVELRPLTKFPIVADLQVDRSVISEGLKEVQAWLADTLTEEELAEPDALGRCLACGCCVESCTNYSGDADFVGALAANAAFMAYKKEQSPEVLVAGKKKYTKKFFNGCSNSSMCDKVCPMGIPSTTDLTKKTDPSVWRIWKQK